MLIFIICVAECQYKYSITIKDGRYDAKEELLYIICESELQKCSNAISMKPFGKVSNKQQNSLNNA